MWRIDDLVDDRKATGQAITAEEAGHFKAMITDWLDSVRRRHITDAYQEQFIATLDRFQIPFWPWERLARAMAYDLDHEGYESFSSFLRYTEGAAIAPAAIFMHLCGVTGNGERYEAPPYDIRKAARPLALFSYLVHIIRDFQKDQLVGLNYFATNLMTERNLTVSHLRAIAEGEQISDELRDLVGCYVRFAHYYQGRALSKLADILPCLDQRYQLSLSILHQLYLQVLERVDIAGGCFTAQELMPPPDEVNARIRKTIDLFEPVTSQRAK
jgi:phytoene/squalene synthetase